MRFKDKVVIITGAGQGIGQSVAQAFTEEGANLSLNAFGQKEEEVQRLKEDLTQNNNKVIINTGNITDEQNVKSLISDTIKEFGKIDVLINVAGIANQSLVEDLEVETWDNMININLKSVFLTTKYTVPYMKEKNAGRIINFASQLAQKGGREVSHYVASKAAVIGFTKAIALELGEFGINANCVAPGPIETAMLAGYDSEWKEKKIAELPLRRFGKVEEVVPTVLMLAADPDGNIYTGQTLSPNSGDVMF